MDLSWGVEGLGVEDEDEKEAEMMTVWTFRKEEKLRRGQDDEEDREDVGSGRRGRPNEQWANVVEGMWS